MAELRNLSDSMRRITEHDMLHPVLAAALRARARKIAKQHRRPGTAAAGTTGVHPLLDRRDEDTSTEPLPA